MQWRRVRRFALPLLILGSALWDSTPAHATEGDTVTLTDSCEAILHGDAAGAIVHDVDTGPELFADALGVTSDGLGDSATIETRDGAATPCALADTVQFHVQDDNLTVGGVPAGIIMTALADPSTGDTGCIAMHWKQGVVGGSGYEFFVGNTTGWPFMELASPGGGTVHYSDFSRPAFDMTLRYVRQGDPEDDVWLSAFEGRTDSGEHVIPTSQNCPINDAGTAAVASLGNVKGRVYLDIASLADASTTPEHSSITQGAQCKLTAQGDAELLAGNSFAVHPNGETPSAIYTGGGACQIGTLHIRAYGVTVPTGTWWRGRSNQYGPAVDGNAPQLDLEVGLTAGGDLFALVDGRSCNVPAAGSLSSTDLEITLGGGKLSGGGFSGSCPFEPGDVTDVVLSDQLGKVYADCTGDCVISLAGSSYLPPDGSTEEDCDGIDLGCRLSKVVSAVQKVAQDIVDGLMAALRRLFIPTVAFKTYTDRWSTALNAGPMGKVIQAVVSPGALGSTCSATVDLSMVSLPSNIKWLDFCTGSVGATARTAIMPWLNVFLWFFAFFGFAKLVFWAVGVPFPIRSPAEGESEE